MSQTNKKPLIKLRSFYLWHRYIGINAALFVIILAITGIALNHTDSLELDRQYVSNQWLLNWYDIEPPQRIISYATKNHSVSLVEDKLYLNDQVINGYFEYLAGIVRIQDMLIIAADTQLLLFTLEGELIERLTSINGRRQLLGAIGVLDKNLLAIQSDNILLTDMALSNWQTANNKQTANIQWSAPQPLNKELHQQLLLDYQAHILTWERITLDIHSGRIFGQGGVLLMDGAAILLLLLSLSGYWMWWQQRRKRLSHRHK